MYHCGSNTVLKYVTPFDGDAFLEKLSISGYKLYIVLLLRNHSMESLCKNFFLPCMVNSDDKKGKGKAIPVTHHGSPQGCEMSRLPHFLDNWLTDGGKAVSLTCQMPFTSRNIPGAHFC
jgi:hypothetical protein